MAARGNSCDDAGPIIRPRSVVSSILLVVLRFGSPDPCCHELPPPQLLEGIEQFNRGEYFEQHETLEILWRAETRPVRRLYQGILQIGVAFHHLRRRNYHGVVYMLTRGSAYLQPFAPACQRIDVASLIELAASTLRLIEQLGPARLDEFQWEPKPSVRVTE
jgi:uncharacterized protein